jgi:alpha-galactosidase
LTKISFVGAGSTVFMKNILTDILLESELNSSEITLYDIDSSRLKTSQIVADKVASSLKVSASIKSTNDRKKALKEADFVIVMIQVGGYKPSTLIDFEIPAKYGLQQTIADTVGIGGIMRGLRTVPVLVEIAEEMLELCPRAMMLQYVNPMAINCLGLSHFVPELRYVGLCHSVQGTVADLARDIGEDFNKIEFECSGINHMSFFTKFAKKLNNGSTEDLYPKIFQKGETGDFGTNWDGCSNKVRYEVLKKLGYFVTESSEHFAEYTPWFIKSHQKDLIRKFDIPINEYIRRCEKQILEWDKQEKDMLSNPKIDNNKSVEYASRVILSMITGKKDIIYGNVLNTNLIPNLPNNSCVEVPCVVQKDDLVPQVVPPLPIHLANLIQTNISVQQLTVEALKTRKKDSIYYAAMLDPHTAGELNLDQIWKMVDELIDAHGSMLPAFK